jgi:hypothetical protein
MYLTREILDKHNACGIGIEWFETNYPNGAELIELINNPKTKREFLHWGFSHLNTNEEEKQAYYNRLKIVDCDVNTIYKCHNITHSDYVVDSNTVEDSSYIFSSSRVEESSNVSNSKIVTSSSCVYNSSFVTNSNKVLGSVNITDSNNIVNSEYVVGSNSVINGNMVTDSYFVGGLVQGRCMDVSDSAFIFECKNVRSCLFCTGINDKEYHLFNKPISEKHYKLIFKQLLDLLEGEEAALTLEWPCCQIPLDIPRVNRNMSEQYEHLPDDFWEWVESLPNYDPWVLYSITFQNRLIK